MKRILNIIPSKKQEKDWVLAHAFSSKAIVEKKKLPTSVDLRASWWKVANQGETGSCVGWSSTDGVLRWHFVKQKAIQPNEQLSVRFVWMSAKETDEITDRPTTFIDDSGTSLKAALDVIRKYGCVTAKELPFNANAYYKGTEDELYAAATRFKLKAYYNLFKGATSKAEALRKWFASGGGPVLSSINVDKSFYYPEKTKHILEKFIPAKKESGHAICLVGYNEKGIIIRNSWGTIWGDKGFAYATDDYVHAAFEEAYGVSV
jgi:C1A family cysteine protease